LTSTN